MAESETKEATGAPAGTDGAAPPPKPTGQELKAKLAGRGNKVPSPKKVKKAKVEEAVHKVAEHTEAVAAGEVKEGETSALPLAGTGVAALEATERVIDVAERTTLWLRDNWQAVAAGILSLVVVVGFLGWRQRAAEERIAEGFARLAGYKVATMGAESAPNIEALETLLRDTRGTEAAPFVELRIAAALVGQGTQPALDRARDIYKRLRDRGPAPLARTLAADALAALEARLAFKPEAAPLGEHAPGKVEGLAPLPAPSAPAPGAPAPEQPKDGAAPEQPKTEAPK